jgi:hypothetical protein
MDSGKILIGIALVMFSAALMVSPSSAAGNDASRQVGNGTAVVFTGAAVLTDSPGVLRGSWLAGYVPPEAVAGTRTGDTPVPGTNRVSGCP